MPWPLIFISYSPDDEKEKDQLLSHLGALEREGVIDLWSQDRIGPGAEPEAEVSRALAEAQIAVLLITAGYLDSDLPTTEALPLRRRQERGEVKIIPLIAKACPWRTVDWLSKLAVRPTHRRPVWREDGRHADDELAAIAEEISVLLGRAPAAPSEPDQDEPVDSLASSGQSAQGSYIAQADRGSTASVNVSAFDQRGQQVRTQYNVTGDLVINPPLPPLKPPDPETLAEAEQLYRQRLKARFAEEASYYIPLAGETTEAVSGKPKPKALQLAMRHRQKTKAEYHEWVQAGQEIKRVKLSTLREGVDKYDCIILLGDPGSGKTTALEHLAYEMADEAGRLPVPLRLSEFGPGMTVAAFIKQGWAGSEQAGYWAMPELAANLTSYLEQGKLFLLLDALNEMPHEGYPERALALRQFIDHWSAKGNRFLVTCRVLDYGEELSGLQRIEVQPFTADQVQTFIQHVLGDKGPALWQELVKEKDEARRLLELARNPYMLTMMVVLFDEIGHLGRNRAELMTDFTSQLLIWAEEKCDPQTWLAAEAQTEALAVMAFEMQARAGFGTMVKTQQVKAVLPKQVQPDPAWPPVPVPADQVLSLAASAHLIEMPGDRSSVRFYHQLLQEYFAARELLKRDPAGLVSYWRWPWLEAEMPLWVRPEDNRDPLPPPPPTGWEETTILAAGLAAENDAQLVRALTQVNPVLAGRCLHEGQAKVDRASRQAVIEALLATTTRPEVALRVRIAAGEVLGYLGDPRLGQLVTVPAGEFVMGGKEEYEGGLRHTLYLPEYRVGQYPVTNAEYAAFIEAGGYREKRWWTEAGWRKRKQDSWTEPRFWPDSRYNKPNQPVVGVSWYEAAAYCRWLSAETGQSYRLPTEAEWEKAARGVDGRTYPWGNDFEASRCNAYERGQQVGTTTPVGIYPTGVSSNGAYDCAGNVWEWCATKWGKSYPYDAKEDEWAAEYLKGTDVRVLRGGAWGNRAGYARCAYRVRLWFVGDLVRGLRVRCSPIK